MLPEVYVVPDVANPELGVPPSGIRGPVVLLISYTVMPAVIPRLLVPTLMLVCPPEQPASRKIKFALCDVG
jgi:hypothetical protein